MMTVPVQKHFIKNQYYYLHKGDIGYIIKINMSRSFVFFMSQTFYLNIYIYIYIHILYNLQLNNIHYVSFVVLLSAQIKENAF